MWHILNPEQSGMTLCGTKTGKDVQSTRIGFLSMEFLRSGPICVQCKKRSSVEMFQADRKALPDSLGKKPKRDDRKDPPKPRRKKQEPESISGYL